MWESIGGIVGIVSACLAYFLGKKRDKSRAEKITEQIAEESRKREQQKGDDLALSDLDRRRAIDDLLRERDKGSTK